MTERPTIRVLRDPPLDGPTNMARDEVLLQFVGRAATPPTLRMYQWDPPTVSLGYFQRFADFEALAPPAGDLPVVRRTTGGGAILHDQELTYSLVLPTGHDWIRGKVKCLYDLMHRSVIGAMDATGVTAQRCGSSDDSVPTRGPFFCFDRRHEADLLVGELKIAGSAQRRTRDAVLQHGSIMLARRFLQQPSADIGRFDEASVEQLRTQIITYLERFAGAAFQNATWSEEELREVEPVRTKYASNEWTRRM